MISILYEKKTPKHSARLLAATTLRNVLGTKNLGDILSERESIAHEMQTLLFEATEPWGVNVERVEVRKGKYVEQDFFPILKLVDTEFANFTPE